MEEVVHTSLPIDHTIDGNINTYVPWAGSIVFENRNNVISNT